MQENSISVVRMRLKRAGFINVSIKKNDSGLYVVDCDKNLRVSFKSDDVEMHHFHRVYSYDELLLIPFVSFYLPL